MKFIKLASNNEKLLVFDVMNLKRFAARTIDSADLKLEKRKKSYVIYMSVASEPRRGF